MVRSQIGLTYLQYPLLNGSGGMRVEVDIECMPEDLSLDELSVSTKPWLSHSPHYLDGTPYPANFLDHENCRRIPFR